jgi:hypothetical protein
MALCTHCLTFSQNERQLLEKDLGHNQHRNILQLHHVLMSRPYERLRDVAMAAVHDLRRVQWDKRAAFLVTNFVPWTLCDALRVRQEARQTAAKEAPDRGVQWEEYEWTIAVVSDVAEALLHLWGLGFLHMDISTKNVTIAPVGQSTSGITGSAFRPHAVLIDFGSAVRPAVPGSLHNCTGNKPHLAPEVLDAIAAQRRSACALTFDLKGQPVFELGVLAYEVALGGAHPLSGYPDTVGGWTDGGLPELPAELFPPAFRTMLMSCVRHAAGERRPLPDVVAELRLLRAATGISPGYSLPPRPPWVRVDSPAFQEAKTRCIVRTGATADTPVCNLLAGHAKARDRPGFSALHDVLDAMGTTFADWQDEVNRKELLSAAGLSEADGRVLVLMINQEARRCCACVAFSLPPPPSATALMLLFCSLGRRPRDECSVGC